MIPCGIFSRFADKAEIKLLTQLLEGKMFLFEAGQVQKLTIEIKCLKSQKLMAKILCFWSLKAPGRALRDGDGCDCCGTPALGL